MTGPDVVLKTVPGVCGDNLPLRFGSAYDASIVYDGAAEELTLQTKDGAGSLIDRVALRAGINNPSLVVNDPGADMDVRVEGDLDPNLLVLDAGLDRVGIGTATPGSKLTVNGSLAFTTLGAAADLNSQALTNTNIDSGAIDGTPIGAAAAASVRGTTVEGTDATDATSTTAAAMKTAGGLGVAKKAYVGTEVQIGASASNTMHRLLAAHTAAVTTSATVIGTLGYWGGLVLVTGIKVGDTTVGFTDLIFVRFVNAAGVTVISSSGNSDARTYSVDAGLEQLKLAMATTTHSVNVLQIATSDPR